MTVVEEIGSKPGIDKVTIQSNPITDDGKNAKFPVTFTGNPYSVKAFDTVLELRSESNAMLYEADLADAQLFIAGVYSR